MRPADRRRVVVARGLLRELPASATGRDPAALDIRVTALGRPHLHDEALRFSVAHCGDRALVALSLDRPVGVDLERHRPAPHLLDVARRVFAPEAVAALAALPDERRTGVFFDW